VRFRSPTFLVLAGLVAALLMLAQPPAYAYLDPGTGSYLFQALAAGILGGLVALKVFWRKVVRKLKGAGGSEDEDEEDE